MRSALRYLLTLSAAALVIAAAPAQARAQGCFFPYGLPDGCCACLYSDIGWMNCDVGCNGCEISSECWVQSNESRVSASGSVLLPARSLFAGSSAAPFRPVASASAAVPLSWEGVITRYSRDCRGYIVARLYSSDAIAEIRARSRSIRI